MKRALAAIALSSILLWGCNLGSGAVLREDPPPKPPNCPDLPELQNVTLQDGTVADVRIVEFRTTKLYIPADLLEENFYNPDDPKHKSARDDSMYFPRGLNQFSPDMHKEECPGVVHKIVVDKVDGADSPSVGVFLPRKGPEVGKNISPKSHINSASYHLWLPMVYIGTPPIDHIGTPLERYGYPDDDYYSARLVVFDDVYVNYRTSPRNEPQPPVGSPEWNKYKSSMIEFTQWLVTPPRDRDNDKVFLLGGIKK